MYITVKKNLIMPKINHFIAPILIIFIFITYYLIKNFSNKSLHAAPAVASDLVDSVTEKLINDELLIEYIYEDLILIKSGQTFGKIIKKYNISESEQYEISKLLNSEIDLKRLNIGTEIGVTYSRDSDKINIKKISIIDKENNQTNLIKLADVYQLESSSLLMHVETIKKEITIKSSLYQSAVAADVPPNIIMQFVNLYGFDVDFQREIRNGNKMTIYYEAFMDSKLNIIKSGNISFASLTLKKNTYNLYRYLTPDNNKAEYFDEAGKSAVKALMKTPINGASLSSGFGLRKHPILGYDRLHQGVDFAAPSGTPIMAAGTGFIERIGMNGGAGNFIKIKHINGYKTAYGHMSKFASGLKKGTKVTQGQTIGFVGSTGMSTGPHLHYEVIFNNKKINPMAMKLPSGRKLKGKILDDFFSHVRKLNEEINLY